MDSISLLYYLKKLLPELDVSNQQFEGILHSNLEYEAKVEKILTTYFKNKTTRWAHATQSALKTEARCINKMYPSLKLEYIYEQLDIFRDMPNRREIVLRLIGHSKKLESATKAPAKRPHVVNNANNHQPLPKARRVDAQIPSTVTSQQAVAMLTPPPTYLAPLNLQIPNPEPPLPPTLTQPPQQQQNATVTSTVTSAVTQPATDLNFSTPTREPFTESTIMEDHGYEVPDIMQHFALPIVDVQLPVASASTNQSDVENFEPGLAPLEAATEPAITSASAEVPDAVNVEQTAINHPNEHYSGPNRDSQDSNKTEIYSPPREVPTEDEAPTTRHYTVNLLSPTFIRIKQSLVPEQYQDEERVNNQHNVPKGFVCNNRVVMPGNLLIRKNLYFADPLNNLPSTSKESQVNMNLGDAGFNLIEYVREITNASEQVIKRHCKRLHICTKRRPAPDLLNTLIDTILTITVDSEDSDIDDYYADLNEAINDGDNSNQVPLPLIKRSNLGPDNFNDVTNKEETVVTQMPENPEKNNNDETVEVKGNVDTQLVNTLCSMFPEACPKYIRGLCVDKMMNNQVLDDLITTILNTNNQYPKRPKPEPEPEVLPENQLEILKEVLPDADPDFLRMMCEKFEGKPDLVKSFLNEAMERRNYPNKKDYLRRQQLSAQQRQYTTEFNVENFVKVIPDPHAFFSDPSRKLKLNTLDSHCALVFLRNHFNKISVKAIQQVFTKHSGDVSSCVKDLRRCMNLSSHLMKSVRRPMELPNTVNIPLLQELAYYSHEKEINDYLQEMKEKEETERREARDKGLMKTCTCCYDDEVLPRDIFCCENGCEFCKSCIVKSSEVRFGEGKLDFPCLMNCPSSFTVQTLQAVLPPKLFSKVAQKKALEEIKSAGIEELEQCPFCDFATIPAEGYNIFTCMNPECMKESCRMCKEPSHVPLRCDEIEKDEDVRARTFVENKMTEALLRKCYKCGIKFFKEEGCNKMTCSCGAQMCYICGKPVTSYKHFNGNGGDRFDLCPLYSDSNVLNKENVLRGAEQAKAEIGNVNLKHDPTADVDQHFKERRRMFPQEHLLVGQQQLMAPPPLPPPREMPPIDYIQLHQFVQRRLHLHRQRQRRDLHLRQYLLDDLHVAQQLDE